MQLSKVDGYTTYWVFFVILTQTKFIWAEAPLIEEMALSDVWDIFLIND